MKIWYALTCPICRLRHSLRRFVDNLEPITYPAQLVTGGGRASGFHVIQYLPWSTLTSPYRNPELWRAVNCEYIRLAGAYDQFYECLGFLSPQIRELLQTLNHEIFRLQTRCRDLEDRLGTAIFTRNHGGDRSGEFGEILRTVNRRDEEDRRSDAIIIKRDNAPPNHVHEHGS